MNQKSGLKIYRKDDQLIIEDDVTGEQNAIRLEGEPLKIDYGECITIYYPGYTECYDYLGNRVEIE